MTKEDFAAAIHDTWKHLISVPKSFSDEEWMAIQFAFISALQGMDCEYDNFMVESANDITNLSLRSE